MTAKSYGKKNDIALSTWTKLARAHSVVYHLSSENIRSYGLTISQFGVIEAVGHLGPLKVGELCDKMLVSGGNMTFVLDNLEKQGYIKRDFSKDDRRAIIVQLTDSGRELFDQIFTKHAQYLGDLFSVLSFQELNQLGNLLKKLGVSLQKQQ